MSILLILGLRLDFKTEQNQNLNRAPVRSRECHCQADQWQASNWKGDVRILQGDDDDDDDIVIASFLECMFRKILIIHLNLFLLKALYVLYMSFYGM